MRRPTKNVHGPRRRRPTRATAVVTLGLAASASLLCAGRAADAATTYSWVGSSGGYWSGVDNWSPAFLPLAGDDAYIYVTPGGSYSVTYNSFFAADGPLHMLRLHSTNGFPLTLRQNIDGSDLYATYEYVADSGNATYAQSAATNAPNTLVIGYTVGSAGTYSLSGTGALAATYEYAGYSGTGTFIHSAGTNDTTYLYLGYTAGSSGSYSLSGTGVLSATSEFVGRSNNGTFTQSGGTNTLTNILFLSNGSGSTGSYTLSGGLLDVGGGVYVGGGAGTDSVGSLAITGGTASVRGIFKIYDHPGNSVSLSGGTLSVSEIDSTGHPERFHWTGGTLNFHDFGYTLDADLFPGANLTLTPAMTLSAEAASANRGSLTLDGGTLGGSGSLTNSTLLTAHYGAIDEPLANAAGATLQFGPGRTTALSSSLLNSGYLFLDSSPLVTGTGSITNSVYGVIAGRGSLAVDSFTNGGTIAIGDGSVRISTAGGGYDNTGVIRLDSPAASLFGSTVNNTGTIEGRGAVTASVANAAGGTVEAVGGTLALGGTVTNAAGATLRASAGNKLLISGYFATNAGTILLTGGTLDTAGDALFNTGTIAAAGAGTSTFAVPLTNDAGSAVIVSGGATAVFTAAVANVAGSEFRVSAGSAAVFFAPVTGAGAFTGTGDKFFEAGASSPASLVTGGGTTVRAAASLATSYLREGALVAYGPVVLAAGAPTSHLGSLDLTATGTLDLSDDRLVLDYAAGAPPVAQVREYLRSRQLFSSAADADSQHLLGIGYVDNALLGAAAWGDLAVGPASVLTRLTYLGDANLDGIVNADDYALLDRGYAAGGAFWWQGDFDYDGAIDENDYLLIDTTYGQIHGLSPELLARREQQFGSVYVSQLIASVPEPASLAACGVASILVAAGTGRRRGRVTRRP